jgi:hypothetical protein
MWILQKLANGLRLASINAVEVHSKQTSTDLNATQKHANGLELKFHRLSQNLTTNLHQSDSDRCRSKYDLKILTFMMEYVYFHVQSFSNCRCKLTRARKKADAEETPDNWLLIRLCTQGADYNTERLCPGQLRSALN